MQLTRILAAGSVTLTGIGLGVGAAGSYLGADVTNLATLTLVLMGGLIGTALIGAGGISMRATSGRPTRFGWRDGICWG